MLLCFGLFLNGLQGLAQLGGGRFTSGKCLVGSLLDRRRRLELLHESVSNLDARREVVPQFGGHLFGGLLGLLPGRFQLFADLSELAPAEEPLDPGDAGLHARAAHGQFLAPGDRQHLAEQLGQRLAVRAAAGGLFMQLFNLGANAGRVEVDALHERGSLPPLDHQVLNLAGAPSKLAGALFGHGLRTGLDEADALPGQFLGPLHVGRAVGVLDRGELFFYGLDVGPPAHLQAAPDARGDQGRQGQQHGDDLKEPRSAAGGWRDRGSVLLSGFRFRDIVEQGKSGGLVPGPDGFGGFGGLAGRSRDRQAAVRAGQLLDSLVLGPVHGLLAVGAINLHGFSSWRELSPRARPGASVNRWLYY